jgi:hypothetical protein
MFVTTEPVDRFITSLAMVAPSHQKNIITLLSLIMINKEQEQKWESARGSDLCTHCHHFLLIIPEIVLRVCTSEQLGCISTSPV